MNKFVFILLLFSQSVIFGQTDNDLGLKLTSSRFQRDSISFTKSTYALNDIGVEYQTMVLADLKDNIDEFIVEDTLPIEEVEKISLKGDFSMNLKNGTFGFLHGSNLIVYESPNKITKITNAMTSSVYYKFDYGDCYTDLSNPSNAQPFMSVEIVYRRGEMCIYALECNEECRLNKASSEKAHNLWKIFSPVAGY